jgi:hypothetical protein
MRNLRIFAVAISALSVFGVSSGVAQAATTLDQSYDAANSEQAVPRGSLGQVVTPGLSGQLTDVEVNLVKLGRAPGGVTVSIRNVSAGLPTGSDLAAVFIPDSSIGTVASWIPVNFSTPVTITAGTPFAIVVSDANNANEYFWRLQSPGTYAGGEGSRTIPSWTLFSPSDDFNFRTYVDTSRSDATPPPVLQQFGMPSSGTCDASAPIILNWGGAGSGGWGNSWAQWANGGKGGAVCTRTLVYSNSASRWIVG